MVCPVHRCPRRACRACRACRPVAGVNATAAQHTAVTAPAAYTAVTINAPRRARRPVADVSRLWLAVGLAGVVLMAPASCAGPATSVVPPSVPSGRALTSDETLAAIRARAAGLDSLKGLFHADVRPSSDAFAVRIQGTLFYQRPRTLRIRGYTRLGEQVFDLLVLGESYALRVPDRQQEIVGRAPDWHRLGDLSMPVRLSLHAVEMLLGNALGGSTSHETRVEADAYRYVVPSAGVSGRPNVFGVERHVWVDRHSAHIRAMEYRTPEDDTLVALTASDFRRVGDVARGTGVLALPFVVGADDRVTTASVALTFLELTANVPLPDKTFLWSHEAAPSVEDEDW